MEAWTGFDDVTVVDACRGAGPPGSIHRLSVDSLERLTVIAPHRRASTHGMGTAAAIALSRALGSLPCSLLIYAIEGRHFEAGRGLSPDVDHAVDELVALLVQQARSAAVGPGPAGDT
jgi:hydrogenase maturation protease